MKYKLQQLDRRKVWYDQYKRYIDGPSGQGRCLGSVFMIIIAYQSIDVEKTVFGQHFQGSRQMLLNTLRRGISERQCMRPCLPSDNFDDATDG